MNISEFLSQVKSNYPAFAKNIEETARRNPVLFPELGEQLISWARGDLGDGYVQLLMDGYVALVMDVNRGQFAYEKRGRYEHSSYAKVFALTYDNPSFMENYHWGVYAATFLWEHHLRIYDYFRREFVERLISGVEAPSVIDLGCGSGVWSLLMLRSVQAQSQMVDISKTTVANTRRFVERNGFADRAHIHEGDALTFRAKAPCDFGISSFLLEHLEHPGALLANIAANLKPGAHAFVTTALTAAETDHIFEFRRESEVIELCESEGFRVIGSLSLAPPSRNEKARFLPRSMALLLQKRHGEVH